MRRRLLLAAFLAIAAAACPPSVKSDKSGDKSGAGAPCSKVGQTCEIAAGKLGTCVQRDDCPPGGTAGCFACQSQH
jgi:hypothetical protein